jgi:hypothetical protein
MMLHLGLWVVTLPMALLLGAAELCARLASGSVDEEPSW